MTAVAIIIITTIILIIIVIVAIVDFYIDKSSKHWRWRHNNKQK